MPALLISVVTFLVVTVVERESDVEMLSLPTCGCLV